MLKLNAAISLPGSWELLNVNTSFTSPNFNERPKGCIIKYIVIHHTKMASLDEAISRLCSVDYKVSSHYIIGRNGYIFQLVQDSFRAWHAGVSYWNGDNGLNDYSIGIELDNNGREPFSKQQMGALANLCACLMRKYNISKANILSHHEIAPNRKVDPSSYFDWEYLAKYGIGLFPKPKAGISIVFPSVINLQKALKEYGYKLEMNGTLDISTKDAICSFRRRYCADSFRKEQRFKWDFEAQAKLTELNNMIKNEKRN